MAAFAPLFVRGMENFAHHALRIPAMRVVTAQTPLDRNRKRVPTTNTLGSVTGQTQPLIVGLEQLQIIRPVSQVADTALAFLEGRMGNTV